MAHRKQVLKQIRHLYGTSKKALVSHSEGPKATANSTYYTRERCQALRSDVYENVMRMMQACLNLIREEEARPPMAKPDPRHRPVRDVEEANQVHKRLLLEWEEKPMPELSPAIATALRSLYGLLNTCVPNCLCAGQRTRLFKIYFGGPVSSTSAKARGCTFLNSLSVA